ncbi:YeeE/YedE thiosulfate transporter family protein [Lysobacter solisilvae (ex Woo and Kim 2020)]|nr:YeeE/YedE thiosulfate transporter family protein [Lysobacter terrestris]
MNAVSFAIGMVAIGLMGFANQRGPICTVGAIREIVTENRYVRFSALLEASLWVGGGLVLLNGAGLLPQMPQGYVASAATIIGGALLGLGAFINGTCAVGTIARIGARHWAYLWTLVGFFLGSLAMAWLALPRRSDDGSILLVASAWLIAACGVLLTVRLLTHGRGLWRTRITPLRYVWSPHVATTILGLCFLIAFVTVGAWSYTDTLGGLARGMTSRLVPSLLLFLALFTGALIGGWTTDASGANLPKGAPARNCLLGGGLMGAGAALVPGGNDGLILIGMPLLWPYAWTAFASMCVTIYMATLFAHAKLRRHSL